MTATLTYTGKLVITSCWCGIRLAIPDDLYSIASRKGTSVYCPLGHTFVYGDTENERLKKEAEVAKQQARIARASRDAAWDQAQAAHRSAAAYKGHVTRLRNRIANGVCPVAGCRRHFDNVQAHIETVHPDWAHDHPEALT